MVKMLFKDVTKAVCLNKCIIKLFKIESGLGKGAQANFLPLSYCRGSLEFRSKRLSNSGTLEELP
jgi:hypothetical protein